MDKNPDKYSQILECDVLEESPFDGEDTDWMYDETDPDKFLARMDKCTPEQQLYFAQRLYSDITNYMVISYNNFKYGSLYLMNVSKNDLGMVYYEASDYIDIETHSRDIAQLGDKWKFDIDKHPAIQRIQKGDFRDGEVLFEISLDKSPLGLDTPYIAYYPIAYDGEVKAALCMEYDWDQFRYDLLMDIAKIALIMMLGFLLLLVIMAAMFYRMFVKPMSKIQSSLRDYIKTKDSKAVQQQMSQITANNELGVLSEDVKKLAVEIEQYTRENTHLAEERQRTAAELNLAAKIQLDNLPKDFPNNDRLSVYGSMTPAKVVGGDFYDFFYIDEDHLALVIADVSGKSVPAALFMMMSKRLIDTYAVRYDDPAMVFETVNEELCRNNDEQMFVTAWLGVLEISSGRLRAVNAGHEAPAIRHSGGEFSLYKDKHALFLGGMPGTKYSEYTLTLEKGSTLFIYTDGVPEATSSQEELFGSRRMVEALNKDPDAEPEQLLENVQAAVNDFIRDAAQFDDLTMLALKLK
ncbi:MAG: SpoIIE family protein phosphatase [Ruminococcus sp.]|nr:SpoIIE family protein phosphatase [Ruminococcus sp.]